MATARSQGMFVTGRVLGSLIASLSAVAVSACGSSAQTSITQVWKAPISVAPIKSVIVFAAHLDEANRRSLEDAYVAVLAQRDVTARQSYAMFPGEPPAREQARDAVRKAGFEGILVSTLRSTREKQTYVPGTYDGGFWAGYYGPGWGYWSPGYVASEEIVSFDTTLWDTRAGDQLVFALTTDTTNPSSNKDFIQSLSKGTVAALEKQRLIPPERSP